MTYGEYQGVFRSQWSYDLDWYVTDSPILVPCILGPDTVTGTVAPYTHTFNLATAEPTSLSVRDFNGIDTWMMAGSRLSQLQFKLDAAGALSAAVQGQGFAPSNVTLPVPTFETNPYYLGWEGAVTFAATTNNHLVSMTLTLARKLTPRYGAVNSQQPTFLFVGPLEISGSMTFDVEDDTEYNFFLNNTQPAAVITLSQPSTTNQVVFQMSKCALTKAAFASGKDYLQLDASFTGVYNTTDAGPGLVKVLNAQATAY